MLQVGDKFITVRAYTSIVSRNQGRVMHNCNEKTPFFGEDMSILRFL